MREVVTTVGEVIGIAIITVGIFMVYPPAAFIFAGAALAFLSYWNAK